MKNPISPGRPLRLYPNGKEYFDVSTDKLVGDRLNLFKGWVCGVGVQNLYIDMDGQVFGASCRVGGCFGNAFDGFTLPKTWLKCTKNACSCGADQFVPKAANEESKALLVNTLGFSEQKKLDALDSLESPILAMEPSDPSQNKQVYWELGRRCNYDCTYCFPGIHNKTDPHKSMEQLMRASLMVEEQFCQGQSVHFVISGGEPTLNPALMDWIKFLSSMGHRVSMHSNGSRHHKYYTELIEYTTLNISVHFDFYRRERLLETISRITAKKKQMKNQGVGHLEVKLMMGPEKVQEALDFERDLKLIPDFTDYCTWAIVPLRDGDFGELIKEGYKESDFELFGERY